MSAATARQQHAAPQSRPVISAPGLKFVPTPAPARGFFRAVLICALLFIGSFGLAFHLNTLMVQGAYDIKNINVELNEVSAQEATLRQEVITVSTPDKLRTSASNLGMVPASELKHLDVGTGAITGKSTDSTE